MSIEEYLLDTGKSLENKMTDFEKSQLEYEGTIRYPAKVLELC